MMKQRMMKQRTERKKGEVDVLFSMVVTAAVNHLEISALNAAA